MHILKTAVRAKIPLIAVQTDDAYYFLGIATEMLDESVYPVRWEQNQSIPNAKAKLHISKYLKDGQVGVTEDRADVDWHEQARWLKEHDSSLIILNPETIHPAMMGIGRIEVPASMVSAFVQEHTVKGQPIKPLCMALSGLSITNMQRVSAMATAKFGEFTPKAIRAMRREVFQTVRGLEEIETEQLFYEPSPRITEWLSLEGKLFKPATNPLLTPRGFLFTGPPGTGKTSGAKYVANQLNVPLYRLDMGMVLSKWAGESDARLMAALKQADSFEPCVLLLDEVEKLFEVGDQSGIVSRLLGSLLWWLQEHTSKVLVIMTTNDQSKIPPELYRAGRVDEEIGFTGLLQTQMLPFILNLAKKLSSIAVVPTEDLEALAAKVSESVFTTKDSWHYPSQARVTEQVLKLIKLQLISKSGVVQ